MYTWIYDADDTSRYPRTWITARQDFERFVRDKEIIHCPKCRLTLMSNVIEDLVGLDIAECNYCQEKMALIR